MLMLYLCFIVLSEFIILFYCNDIKTIVIKCIKHLSKHFKSSNF